MKSQDDKTKILTGGLVMDLLRFALAEIEIRRALTEIEEMLYGKVVGNRKA